LGEEPLLLNCDLIASGTLFRNFIESIALYLICFVLDKSELDKLRNTFKRGKYPFHLVIKILKDLVEENNSLINEVFVFQLKKSYEFYCGFSHFTIFSFGATKIKNNDELRLIGGYYDKNKDEIYIKEVKTRDNLLKCFCEYYLNGNGA